MAITRSQQRGSRSVGRNSYGRSEERSNGRQQPRYNNYDTHYTVADNNRYEDEEEFQDRWGARGEFENDFDDDFEDEDAHRYSTYGSYEDEEFQDDYDDEVYGYERRDGARQGMASARRNDTGEIARRGRNAAYGGGSSYNQNGHEGNWGRQSRGPSYIETEGRNERGEREFVYDRERGPGIVRKAGRTSHGSTSHNTGSNGRHFRSTSGTNNGQGRGLGSMNRERGHENTPKRGSFSHGSSSNGRNSGRGQSVDLRGRSTSSTRRRRSR